MICNEDTPSSESPSVDPVAPVLRRLGGRLGHLYQWALEAGEFDDVWDLCCDHGRLGLHLHQASRSSATPWSSRIHLVDCVPNIIQALKMHYASLVNSELTIACKDAGEIDLPNSGRQLILLAGVGGGTVVDILTKLVRQMTTITTGNKGVSFELMLSPNLKMFEVRRFLQRHDFELLKEEFVTEKGWSHEHLHLKFNPDTAEFARPSLVGSELWRPFTREKEIYLKKQVAHYKSRAQLGGSDSAARAVSAYAELMEGLG